MHLSAHKLLPAVVYHMAVKFYGHIVEAVGLVGHKLGPFLFNAFKKKLTVRLCGRVRHHPEPNASLALYGSHYHGFLSHNILQKDIILSGVSFTAEIRGVHLYITGELVGALLKGFANEREYSVGAFVGYAELSLHFFCTDTAFSV